MCENKCQGSMRGLCTQALDCRVGTYTVSKAKRKASVHFLYRFFLSTSQNWICSSGVKYRCINRGTRYTLGNLNDKDSLLHKESRLSINDIKGKRYRYLNYNII